MNYLKKNYYLESYRPHGIMFHNFHFNTSSKFPIMQGSIDSNEFADIIEFLGPKRIISPWLFLEKALLNKLEPRDLVITFDDGLLCQFEIAAPVLANYNIGAYFFVYSSVFENHKEKIEIYKKFRAEYFDSFEQFFDKYIEKLKLKFGNDKVNRAITNMPKEYLEQYKFYSKEDRIFRYLRDKAFTLKSYENIMDLLIEEVTSFNKLSNEIWMTDEHLCQLTKEDNEIGLHSYSHPTVLASLPRSQQLEEYKKNYLHLKKILEVKPVSVSHPCNSYNQDTLEILKQLEIKIGFRDNMEEGFQEIYEIPREDHANILRLKGGKS
jgi:peptidoglycan/xylan/chitin deacetylase (PgdA/CDA1 family)